jgi:hypothetical protein
VRGARGDGGTSSAAGVDALSAVSSFTSPEAQSAKARSFHWRCQDSRAIFFVVTTGSRKGIAGLFLTTVRFSSHRMVGRTVGMVGGRSTTGASHTHEK